ncbi:asparagine synthetase B family protein [Nocardia aurantia]|uniref:asparagine synthase (glutamine-hydrolyzing) n=1 Tax=Nocardia aurantia TaxID=2585199 RepID=A0A7K0DQM2_9NOCA|nr:asparagine synthase-related protein [Nocardia aurantia]MQY28011.1 Asparagine synthetase [glutamine-hydrolyzing] 1 [Nocardia aurantia]
MSRWCAILTPDDPAGRIRALGGEPVAVTDRYALGTVTGPGAHAELFRAGSPSRASDLVAIGEVTLYNADRLRARLGAAAPPRGCGDGELLLHCYAHLGLDGIAAADGIFALAIADGADLLLVRDHVGGRTLFHARSGGTWAASTSLRALTRWPDLRTGLNLPAVQSFLSFAYLPGRDTLLRDVYEVLPGRCLRLRPDGSSSEEIFWEPREFEEDGPAGGFARGLRELLEDATARRLPAGEPVGVLLSGGIDSSLVTALTAKLHDQPVRTYSISFGDTMPNELAYSGLVAAHCHTRHRVLTVSGEAVAARLAETMGLLDCPVGDPLTVPNLMLAEAVAADGAAVVLNGEGGDPVFGGPKNLPMLIFELSRDDPDPRARARAYLDSYRKCHADLPILLSPEVRAALADAPPLTDVFTPYLRQGHMRGLLNQLLHANLRTKGAHHILSKVERITTAAGVQGRSPLFDRAVIDYAFRIPQRYKLAGTSEKWILKQAVRDLLPDTIVDRPKSGMRVPVQQWLAGPLRELGHDLLLGRSARARGLFREDTIRAWLEGRGALLPRQGGKLWLVLSLELWLRSFEVGP